MCCVTFSNNVSDLEQAGVKSKRPLKGLVSNKVDIEMSHIGTDLTIEEIKTKKLSENEST